MDITKCEGKGCPLKNECYRHRTFSGVGQSYFVDPPFKGNDCEYFIKLERRREEEVINAIT